MRIVALDVDDPGSVQRGVAEVLDKSGRVDILVNNAGIGGGGPIEDVPVDWVKTLFETNYFGVLRVTQAVLPGMRERRAGAIVNVSSVAGRLAVAGHGHYSAVKHALEAMSEALAQEVQRFGIRVAIVEPGVVVTPIFSKAKRWADPASPYFDHVRRLLLLYQKQMPHAAQPADAARGHLRGGHHQHAAPALAGRRGRQAARRGPAAADRRGVRGRRARDVGRGVPERGAPSLRVHVVRRR